MTLRPNSSRIEFCGTVTDGAGTYDFFDHREADKDGFKEKFRHRGYEALLGDLAERGRQPPENILRNYGALQKSNGSWVTPVIFWIGDRVTGHNYPNRVDLVLEGWDQATLDKYRIDTFTMPSDTVTYLADTLPR